MAKVGLRDIVTAEDRAAVMGLRRGPGQDAVPQLDGGDLRRG